MRGFRSACSWWDGSATTLASWRLRALPSRRSGRRLESGRGKGPARRGAGESPPARGVGVLLGFGLARDEDRAGRDARTRIPGDLLRLWRDGAAAGPAVRRAHPFAASRAAAAHAGGAAQRNALADLHGLRA